MRKKINSLFDITRIPQDSLEIIKNFDQIVQGVRPLNSRQLQQLPENIRLLSHQMTDDRAALRLGYRNENTPLSSHVRYFTWWNLVRLTRLFSNLPAKAFPQGEEVCLDLGSGPLTVVTALFLARPELREQKLTWYCLDVSAASMAFGEDIFLSVCAKLNAAPWKIIRVKGSFGEAIKQKVSFITCANMFNELDQATDMPPEFKVKKYYDQLMRYSQKDARFLLIEPGVPKAARTLSLLRDRFIKSGYSIASPCPHEKECPMSGFGAYTGSKNKWCNFAFSTQEEGTGIPERLAKLSKAARLPKDRATLSFICAVPEQIAVPELVEGPHKKSLIRITSDEFRLANYMSGFYACTEHGLALVEVPSQNNTRLPKPPFRPQSGDLIEVKKITPESQPKDQKSGAIKIRL